MVFSNRIGIYEKRYELSPDNLWLEKVTKWKDVWADVSVKVGSRQLVIYQFMVKYFSIFPSNFNVTLNGMLFNVVKAPVIDPGKRWIKFFGKKIEIGEK